MSWLNFIPIIACWSSTSSITLQGWLSVRLRSEEDVWAWKIHAEWRNWNARNKQLATLVCWRVDKWSRLGIQHHENKVTYLESPSPDHAWLRVPHAKRMEAASSSIMALRGVLIAVVDFISDPDSFQQLIRSCAASVLMCLSESLYRTAQHVHACVAQFCKEQLLEVFDFEVIVIKLTVHGVMYCMDIKVFKSMPELTVNVYSSNLNYDTVYREVIYYCCMWMWL